MQSERSKEFRIDSVNDETRYKLLAGLIVPRPIAWVTTQLSGVRNLAPFSFFQVISYRVPRIGLAFEEQHNSQPKDTLAGILTGEPFTISIPQVHQVTEVHATSEPYAQEVSEAEVLGIPMTYVHDWPLPIVRSSPAALLCKLETHLEFGGGETWVAARVLSVSVCDGVFKDPTHFDYSVFRPLGRLLGDLYVDTSIGLLTPDLE